MTSPVIDAVRPPRPLFSVIVPVHNKAPHVRKSLSSILNQTFENFEIIVVDDASTDGSLEEIEKLHDERIRILHRKMPGPGGYAARNLAISRANGVWIAFLDADDEWMPEHLEIMHRLSMAYPNCLFLSCGWIKVSPKGSWRPDPYSMACRTRGPHIISVSEYLTASVEKRRPTHTCVACIKNNEFALGMFPEGRSRRGGDLYAWLHYLARAETMAWTPEVTATYYQNTVNMVTRTSPFSISLLSSMQRDFAPFLQGRERVLLRRFVNRKIFEAWSWNRLRNDASFRLRGNLDFSGDSAFCLSRTLVSYLPTTMLRLYAWLKARVRFRSLLPFLRKRR